MNKQIRQRIGSSLFHHVERDYTPEELAELTKRYEEATPSTEEKLITKGTVLAITSRYVILDINGKASGVVALSEFKDVPNLKIGTETEVYLEKQEDMEGEPVLSRKKAKLIRAWEMLCAAYKEAKILQGCVKRAIKGGLVLDIFGLEVFMPGSLINIFKTTNFEEYVGKILDVIIAKINEKKDNVVVSRRKLLEQQQAEQISALINSLEKGQVLMGTIKDIANYGLFVNIQGVVGLLHKSEIVGRNKIEDLTQAIDGKGRPLFRLDQEIEVVVKDFDLDKNHISLSTKMLAWSYLPEDIAPGARVKGIVKEITDKYALLEIIDGVIALLYISEITYDSSVKYVQDVLSLGQELEVEVLAIDRSEQKLQVSLKQLLPDPWEEKNISKYVVNGHYEAKITSVVRGGLYLQLESGVEGFLRKKSLSWTKRMHNLDEFFKEGDVMKVIVLDIEHDKRSLSLGFKELEEDPWPSFSKEFVVGSVHKARILKMTASGALVELPHGLETFVPNKSLDKKEIKQMKEGDVFEFYVVAIQPEEQKISISRTNVVQEKTKDNSLDHTPNVKESTTLGDLAVLQQLKAELAEKDKKDKKSKKARKEE